MATKEQENFYRAASIILNLCSKVLREGLAYHSPPSTCPITVKQKGINLNGTQAAIVKDISRKNTYDECDISLLYLLYRTLVIGEVIIHIVQPYTSHTHLMVVRKCNCFSEISKSFFISPNDCDCTYMYRFHTILKSVFQGEDSGPL